MAQGSNDLNALLKAKVVQIKAELDVKGSLPKIKSQIDEISKLLEGKPVKLRVELDHKSSHLNTQIDTLSKKLENKHVKLNVKFDMTVKDAVNQFNEIQKKVTGSKSFQPIKIDVQIDVKGSADNIKKQLKDVHDTVTDFNKKYGQQLAQMQQKAQQTQNKMKSIQSGAINPTPTNGQIGGFNLKQYVSQVKDAERALKGSFGKGFFSSHEMKDAEGNLQGFIASLTKANGVVQKIHYQWNAEQKTFTPVSQQTITNMEKSLHKAKQLLQSTYADIEKLKDGGGKSKLFDEFNNLEKRIGHNTLTEDAVKNLQRMIKEEGVLQQQIKQATEETKKQNRELLTQEKLIHNIEKAMNKDFKRTNNIDRRNQFKDLKSQVNADPENAQKYAFQLQKINEEISREIQKEKELARIEEKKLSFQEQVRKLKANTVSTDKTSQTLLRELDVTIRLAKTNKDFYEIKKKIASVKTSNNNAQDIQKIEAMSEKVKESLRQLNDRGLITSQKLEEALAKVPQTALRGLQDLTNQYNAIQRRINKQKSEDKRRNADAKILVNDENERKNLKNMVLSPKVDITHVQKYVEALYKARVETISMRETTDTLGRAVTELDVKMKGTGKQVKSYTLQMENANGTLRQTAQATSFNANRNLGVFEQLKIAMARVPVWMASMTAFYGTLHTLQAFGREILEVDKSMTELRRVASSNINIETVFEGAVDLSAELGNNIHDIMNAVNDLARTYGDFNERQLLAVARTATLMSNVSDLSLDEATQSLVGTMNAFNIEAEDSIRIVDSLNEVDNDYAISTKQLAEGLQKASSTASTFGVTMEENVGHITAIGAVTMESGAIIGNSLKTIYSRITTVNEAKGALEGVGVEMYKIGENGQKSIKPVNDILKDLAGRWGDLSAEQKQNLAVTVAGRYQLSRFLALMNNWDTATKSTETALSSQGSAIRENAKYMESFEARINKLKNAFTELSLSMGEAFMSNGMSLLISGLTSLAQVAVDIVDKFGALPIVIGVVGLLAQKMGLFSGTITEVRQAVTRYRASMTAMQATTMATGRATATASVATGTLSTAMTGAVVRVRALNIAMKGLLASSVVGVVFVAIGYALEKLMGHMEKQRAIAEKTAKVNKQLVDSYRNTEGGLENLIKEQQELQDAVDSRQIKRGTDEWTKYVEVTNKLAEKMPSVVKYVDQQGLAHLRTSKAIQEQLKYSELLSNEQAKLEEKSFSTNIDKQLEAYDKEMEKIKKLRKEKQKLKEEDGKQDITVVRGFVVNNGKKDTKKEQQELLIDTIQSEMKKQQIIQKTMGVIQNTTLAYLESNKQLKDLTDSGRKALENMVQQNEELLRVGKDGKFTNDTKVIKENADALLKASQDVGQFISDTYENMTQGVEDPLKLKEIRGNLDGLIDALPDTFFKASSIDGIRDVEEKFKGVLSIADQVKAGSGNFDNLTDSLVKIGFTSDEAKSYVTKLGLQYDNAKIKSQALTQAQNEGSDSLENWVDTAIKAIDTSQQLFNINDEDTSALKSHIENLQQLKLVYGDNAVNVQSYKDSLEAISLYTGLPEDVISKDTNYLHNVVDLVGKAELKYDDATGALIGFNKEGLNKNQVNMLNQIISVGKEGGATYDLFTGKITRVKDGVELVFDKTGKLVEKVKEANQALQEKPAQNGQQEIVDETSKALDTVKSKIDANKNTKLFNEEDSSVDNTKLKVNGVEDALKKMQDRSYQLKQEQIFGDEPKADTTKKAIDDVGTSADVTKQKLDNYKRKQEEIFNAQPKTDATKSKINELVESIKKATSSAELLGKLNGIIDGTAKKLGNLLSKVKEVASGIGSISSKSSSISKSVKAIASAYESLSAKSTSASTKVKQAIDNQKKALAGLKKSSEEAKSSVNKSFTSMADTVSKKTTAMISKHNAQKSAINGLKDASNRAREAISNLNSSMDSAMGSLDRYISKAGSARAAGNSVPSASHFAVDSLSVPNINGLTGGISYGGESFASAMSTVGGMGATGGGDSGTSGTLVPPKPTFVGYRTVDGGFEASAVKKYNMRDYNTSSSSSKSSSSKSSSSSSKSSSSKSSSSKTTTEKKKATAQSKQTQKENLAEAFTYNALERAVNAYNVAISLQNESLDNMDKSSTRYRDGLKKLIALENSKMATMKKDLAQTEARQKAIESQLKKLPAVSKQNASQRDQYNKLMQEYDQNINKIGSLKTEIASIGNDIKQQSLEIFTDFIDQIVSSYDKAVKVINDKIDDIDFNLQVLELTDPENVTKEMDALNKKAQETKNAQATAKNKVDTLDKEYKKEYDKQGNINAKEERATLNAEKKKQADLNKKREKIIKDAKAKYDKDVKKYGANSKQAKASKSAYDKAVSTDKTEDAKAKKKIDDLEKKAYDAYKTGANSPSAKKAKEEVDKAKEEYEDATIEALQAEKAIKDARLEIANDGIEALKDYYKQQKDMAIDAIDKQMDLEQEAHDKKMKQYDEEVNGINAIYDAKFKKMDEQKDKESYEEELADKNKKKSDLVNKIALLSRDNSVEGKKKVAELKAQLEEMNKEIADFQENRADQLLRDELTQQKEDAITSINGGYDENGNKIEGSRDKEQEAFDQRMDNLNKEKEEVSKYYDDLVNNEAHWQKIRDDAIKGSFTLLNTEMTAMGTNIQNMQKGIFDGLYKGFSDLSDEAKKYVAEVNGLNVDNLDLATKGAIDNTKEANSVKTVTTTGKGTTVTTPNQTTPAKTSTTSTSKPKSSTTTKKEEPKKSTTKPKETAKPKEQVDRKTTTALSMRKSPAYGNNIIYNLPKGTKVDYVGMEKGWAKIKYKGKTGYVGAKYLQKFDTGGYTGDWVGNEGKMAMLHKKELVLNERQTSDILNVAKIMDKVKSVIPDLKRNILAKDFAEGEGATNITNYNLTVNIDTLTGDKKGADTVVKEIMKGLKKRGH